MIQTSEKPARRGNQRRRSCFSVSLRPPVVIRSANVLLDTTGINGGRPVRRFPSPFQAPICGLR